MDVIVISGYNIILRLDKMLGPKRGFVGVAIFLRVSLVNIALVEYSVAAERMWFVLYIIMGALLLRNLYREHDEVCISFAILKPEIDRFR